jgi:hypothetical protein
MITGLVERWTKGGRSGLLESTPMGLGIDFFL